MSSQCRYGKEKKQNWKFCLHPGEKELSLLREFGQRLRDNWSNKPRDNQGDNSRNENYNSTVDVETLAGIITSVV